MFQVHVTFLISSGKIYCPGHAHVSFNLGAIFSVNKQKEHHFGTKYMPWNIIYFWQLLQGHVKISELSKIYFIGLKYFYGIKFYLQNSQWIECYFRKWSVLYKFGAYRRQNYHFRIYDYVANTRKFVRIV